MTGLQKASITLLLLNVMCLLPALCDAISPWDAKSLISYLISFLLVPAILYTALPPLLTAGLLLALLLFNFIKMRNAKSYHKRFIVSALLCALVIAFGLPLHQGFIDGIMSV